MYGYKGCVSALRAIVEHLAILHGIIDKVVDIPAMAWGVPGEIPYYERNSNFTEDELNLFSEEVRLLMFQNVLSAGTNDGLYSDDWPAFHVTKYGLRCIAERDVLPYDPEQYLTKLQTIPSFDEWEQFYLEQGLTCYNAGALESAVVMLGLSGEYLAGRLIEAMTTFLSHNEQTMHTNFMSNLAGKTLISQRYAEYEDILKEVNRQKDQQGNDKYPQLISLKPLLDVPAKTVYATYLRLTRNELVHPSGIKMDRIECLTMFTSYIKYCETQHKYLDFYLANS